MPTDPFEPGLLLPYRLEEVDALRQEFDLETFDFDQLVAHFSIDANRVLCLNPRQIRKPTRALWERYAQAAKPFALFNGGVKPLHRSDPITLMRVYGRRFTWQPCGPDGPAIDMMTFCNPSSMVRYYCPPLKQ